MGFGREGWEEEVSGRVGAGEGGLGEGQGGGGFWEMVGGQGREQERSNWTPPVPFCSSWGRKCRRGEPPRTGDPISIRIRSATRCQSDFDPIDISDLGFGFPRLCQFARSSYGHTTRENFTPSTSPHSNHSPEISPNLPTLPCSAKKTNLVPPTLSMPAPPTFRQPLPNPRHATSSCRP